MELIWWTIIIIMFLLSFIGIIAPGLPGVPMLWIGFMVYHFAVKPIIGWNFWLTMILLTIIIFTIDLLASSTWVRRWGGSKASAWSAIGGVIFGPFLLGPLGVILGPMIFVVVTELLRGANFDKALRIGLASLIGLIGGSVLKAILQFIMIIVFIVQIF